MATPVRGLRDIRTLSGRANETLHPHMAYMRITCLEMERARRNKERASATSLVGKIDARFKEIEVEKDRLLRAVESEAACVRLLRTPPRNQGLVGIRLA